jgi:hypothetical protein
MVLPCCLHVPPFQFLNLPHDILYGHHVTGGQPNVIMTIMSVMTKVYMIMKIIHYGSEQI